MPEQHADTYLLPFEFGTRRLMTRLAPHVACEPDAPGRWEDCILDSFDWRLHADGKLLLHRLERGQRWLMLFRAAGPEFVTMASVTRLPAWPADVPADDLRAALAKPLEMRMLLPLAWVSCRYDRLRVLDDDDKTVARLQVERREVRRDKHSEVRTLLPRVRVLPVKGYGAEAANLRRLLAEELELPAVGPLVFEEALAAIDREPGDYSSRLDIQLRATLPTLSASQRIFRHLLATLEANIEGAKVGEDSEFLHDLRVATRRTRSALTQIKGILPPLVLDDFRERFAWLGQVTGPLRDIDVFLLKFDGYRARLPAGMQPALQPLRAYLEKRQKAARSTLRRHLNSPAFLELLAEWRARIGPRDEDEEKPFEDAPPVPDNRERPAGEVAAERIWKMYRRVLREGRAIEPDSPADDLHELRKSCKKLRYLMEFFASLYAGEAIHALVKETKKLLDNLGDFQDMEVQANELRGFAADMQKKGLGDMETKFAIGALIADLLRRQEEAHAEFAERFAAFDSKPNRKAYKALFRPAGPAQDAAR